VLDLHASHRLSLILPTYPADVFIGAHLVGDPEEARCAVEALLERMQPA
jgi:hypothetical protein